MGLVIRALSLNEQPLTQAISGQFDMRGGTIGRSDSNTIALPDPERHISRLQAEVMAQDGRFWIRNVGAANPILHNGRALGPGEQAPLGDRDELQIGAYVLCVQLDDDDDGRTRINARAPTDARTVIAASAGEHRTHPGPPRASPRPAASPPPAAPLMSAPPPTDNPFADLLAPAPAASGSVDPFAFLGTPAAPPASAAPRAAPPAFAPPPMAPPAPIAAPAAPAALPDDFDPFADLAAPAAPASRQPPPPVDAPFSLETPFGRAAPPPAPAPRHDVGMPSNDLLGSVGATSAESSSIDDLFGLAPSSGASSADPLAAFLGGPPAAGPAPLPAAFDHTPELNAAYAPPRVAAPPAPRVAPPPPARATAAASASGDALWQAFCAGAGIRVDLPQGLNPEQMQVMGQIVRQAIEGTLRLIALRAKTKEELGAAMTTIRSKNNNPLKFSADDPRGALEQILQPPLRGFMPGPLAVQDAMHDLVGHTVGTIAGMRAALAGVLGRFEPQQLEAKLTSKSVIDSVLPMNRKAKLWELYLQHFDAIRNEAQDDFDTLFGKAFVAAYEDALDRLPHGT